jgi:hypothetical protein
MCSGGSGSRLNEYGDIGVSIKFVLSLNLSLIISYGLLVGSAYGQLPVKSGSQPSGGAAAGTPMSKPVFHWRPASTRMRTEYSQIHAQLPVAGEPSDTGQGQNKIQGKVTCIDMAGRFSERLDSLTRAALDRVPKYKEATKAVDHFSTRTQRTVKFAKDAANYAIPYRGFSMSIEGSRIVQDKDQKLNNLCIAELTQQRLWDEMHPKIMTRIMQMAMGLGLPNAEDSQRVVQQGLDGLASLVGKEDAEATLAVMTDWKSQLNVPPAVFQQPAWDVDTSDRIYHKALDVSANGDPLIDFIHKGAKKFDHGKLFNFTASVVESNLAAMTVLCGSPFTALGAESLSTAFVMSTGGPEENKILKELYFGRRIEIRRKKISDEVELALKNYEKALLTHNGPLLAASEALLAELVGPDAIAKVLEHDPVNDTTFTPPIELSKETKK